MRTDLTATKLKLTENMTFWNEMGEWVDLTIILCLQRPLHIPHKTAKIFLKKIVAHINKCW